MNEELKLYIWEDVLSDYTSGVMFALASSVEEAREILLAKCGYLPESDLNKTPKVYENEKMALVLWGGG